MKNLLLDIKKANSILIVMHKKPDGDTLGSGLAFYFLCEHFNKKVDAVTDSPIPRHYLFMEGIQRVNVQSQKTYDLVLVVDCGDAERMGKFSDYAKRVLSYNIDHHKTNDYFARNNIVVPSASSTCEVVYDLLEKEGIFSSSFPSQLKQRIASSLAVGLSTDTGHFKHSTVNDKVFSVAKCLAKNGADFHSISNNLYRSDSKERLALLSVALSGLKYFNNGEIGVLSLFASNFENTNTTFSDTEGFIDFVLSVSTVKVAITITEEKEELFKISFRSKGLDVAKVASVFGGGGHARAAGATVKALYEEVLERVLKATNDEISAIYSEPA